MRTTLLSLSALLLASAVLRAEDGRFDKTVAFPRSGDVRLDWEYAKCTIRGVQVRNMPDRDDIEKARTKEPDDKSWLWWEFSVDNRSPAKCKIKLWVEILDKSGQVIKSGDRSGNVDARETDDIRLPTRLPTPDAADAPNGTLRAGNPPHTRPGGRRGEPPRGWGPGNGGGGLSR